MPLGVSAARVSMRAVQIGKAFSGFCCCHRLSRQEGAIMARIVEFHSSEQPYMSMSEAMYYRLVEPLVYRDLDGVLGDITAACCRRCGEVTLRSDKVGNHLCTTQERTDRLVERGMEAFHAVVSRNDQLAAAQERIAALEAALITR